ncbi:MAG: hypothetical protein Q7U14_07290 [Lacisediminimonas sp.]|nr:hypothetical protein [Polaromonas sp.]MDO9217060.1 hypothetical protein [Lacisediminimonas sp.]
MKGAQRASQFLSFTSAVIMLVKVDLSNNEQQITHSQQVGRAAGWQLPKIFKGTSGGLDHAQVISKYQGLAEVIGRAIKAKGQCGVCARVQAA